MMEKKNVPPQKLFAAICKIAQIFVTFLLLVDVINEWSQFICLCKKWIIVFIVSKLILIYFTCFVHNFVNYKCKVLLHRNDVCLVPLSTFVCVCCVLRPFTVKILSFWNSCNVREQINDVVLKTFVSSEKSHHSYFRMKHWAFLTSHFILFTQ